MSITLAELKNQSRERADQVNSEFISDGELTSYINSSRAELYDILTEAYGSEYFVIEAAPVSVTSGTNAYPLPADFYELKGVDVRINQDDWFSIDRFNFNERNNYTDFTYWDLRGISNIKYRIVGNNIMFTPAPDRVAEYRLWYVPTPTQLVNDTDVLDDQNSYAEYIIVDAAIKMMQKEESDVTVLMTQKMALIKRITDKAANRDAGQAPTISDIFAANNDYWLRGR